ncbi:MAG TPA: polysaccharide biosynthesis protein [Mycobacteriales bacterium]|nr:polysaccharide biosynthesis protein [Mycobacteriales bacterium]
MALPVETTAAVPSDPDRARSELVRFSAMLGPALMAANVASYLLAVLGGRELTTADYGFFGSLLSVLLVASVPALAVQAVVARRTAVGEMDRGQALRVGAIVGAGSAVIGLVITPALAIFLHAGSHAPGLVVIMLSLVPLNVLAGVQGRLQGRERFARLSVLVILIGAGRLLGGVVPLALGAGSTVVMVGIAIGATVAALVGVRMLRDEPVGERAHPVAGRSAVRAEIVGAVLAMGALLLLSNLDLLLGRHVLSGTVSGRYAAGNVVAKIAFWLPQAVALAVMPRLSRGVDRRKALREALLLTAALAGAIVVVAAVAGVLVTRIAFGPRYASIGSVAWLFAVQGGVLAMLQLLILDDIATRRRVVAPLALLAAAVEVVVVLSTGISTPHALIATATLVAAGLGVAVAIRRGLGRRTLETSAP